MNSPLAWLRKNKFTAHTIAFLLMTLTPLPLYFAARAGFTGLIWALIALFAIGNVLAIVIK